MADFETTALMDTDGTTPKESRVWLWAIRGVDDLDYHEEGFTMDQFMNLILPTSSEVFFHNLKYDGGYICDWLCRNGFRMEDPGIVNSPGDNCVLPLISGDGQFYKIHVRTRCGDVVFKDSLKKIPLSVEKMAAAFGLEVSKGEIDYVTYRPEGYIPSPEELDYVRRDVEIVAHALRQTFDQGLTSLTASADALRLYRIALRDSGRVPARGRKLSPTRAFERKFPQLGVAEDNSARAAYRGGFTYADSRTAGEIQGEGIVLDVNSLYPFIMHDRPLPVGFPLAVTKHPKDLDDRRLYISTFTFTARLKPRGIPCIQVRGSHWALPTEYQREINEPTEMRLTSVDWKLINDMYDVDLLKAEDTVIFNSQVGNFDCYIDDWMKIKEASVDGARTNAKLMLNSLYGKFAARVERRNRIPTLENDRVRYEFSPNETTADPVYTPVGVFITAWARDYTIRSAAANYDRFLYADTDSLHLKGTEPPEGLNIHPTHLGAWKIEGTFEKAIFVRAKQYCEVSDGKSDTHIAGLPRKNPRTGKPYDIVPEDLLISQTFGGKLVPKMVPGGTYLSETHFTFTPAKES